MHIQLCPWLLAQIQSPGVCYWWHASTAHLSLVSHLYLFSPLSCHQVMTPWHIWFRKADKWMKFRMIRGKKQATWLMLRSIETHTFTRLFLQQLTSQTLFLPPQKQLKSRCFYKQERDTRRHQQRGAINTAWSSQEMLGFSQLSDFWDPDQSEFNVRPVSCWVSPCRGDDAGLGCPGHHYTHGQLTTNLRQACSSVSESME